MKLKDLLKQYKAIANEMKKEAKNYNNLAISVSSRGCSKENYIKFRSSWLRLVSLNEQAYKIMYEYRKLSGSLFYRVLFFLGIMPKQNTFRFISGNCGQFKCVQMINLLNLR